jgi:cytochrome b
MLDQQTLDKTDGETSHKKTIRVWDLPTRVFHWTLLVLVTVAWVSSEADGVLFNIHVVTGIAVLAMVAFRLVWGVIGSRHALFINFVTSWQKGRDYGEALLAFKPPYHVGHNPLGGWMIIALLATLAFTAFNGLFITEDGFSGPLSGAVSPEISHAMGELHEGVAGFLGFLVGFHVFGVIVHGLMTRENLPRAMWIGDKVVPEGINATSIAKVSWWRVVVAVALSIAAVWSLFP